MVGRFGMRTGVAVQAEVGMARVNLLLGGLAHDVVAEWMGTI